jgi:VanZ family protein
VIWCVAIFAGSSIPDPDVGPLWFAGCDKILHFIEYFVLGITLRYWARGGKVLLAGGVGYAVLDEFHQSFVPGREASVGDFIADALGLVAGYLLAKRFLWVRLAGKQSQGRMDG